MTQILATSRFAFVLTVALVPGLPADADSGKAMPCQCLIKDSSSVHHPLVDAPCPVLQYADDTLILLRTTTDDVLILKSILDSFSAVTDLKINYHKSTIVPMHVREAKLCRLLKVLQCQRASFPQVYLGLPLSN